MEKVIFAWSGGKDSAIALNETQQDHRYQIACLLTTITEGYDRVSMHGVPRVLAERQAKSIGLPLEKVFISPSCVDAEYEAKMRAVLSRYKQTGVSAVAFGDIFLEEVRKYREDNLARLGLKGVFPLWGKDPAALKQTFAAQGFRAVTTCVDSKVLGREFAGRELDGSFWAELPPEVDHSGENGEFHSFVFDGPIFSKRIAYTRGEVVLRDSFYFCDLIPDNAG